MIKQISLILCGIFLLTLVGCNIDLSEQGQKDRALADKVNERLKTRKAEFGDIFGPVTYDKAHKGNYNFTFKKTDLTAQEIFDYTLRLMFFLQEQNDTVVMTGRTTISATGYIGREKVSYGTYSSGPTKNPFKVTLEGKYADEEINETYNIRGMRGGGLPED